MIYPSARSVVLTALGAPAALVIGVMMPQIWYVGLVWVVLLVMLTALDAISAKPPSSLKLELEAPPVTGVGAPFIATVHARFVRKDGSVSPRGAPRRVEIAAALGDRLDPSGSRRAFVPMVGGQAAFDMELTPNRRGPAEIAGIWARWQGPLGLAWAQKHDQTQYEIAVTPDISPIYDEGVQLFLRDAAFGLIAQIERGEGNEFEALTEFQTGMDKRAIDWKQSARHLELLAKEYRTERNNHIVFALDAGRTMCEPIEGVPRIDRAITGALLTAYVALKAGDRASLFAFAGRPMLASPTVSGAKGFATIQRAAGAVDYSAEESNYTLALTSLSNQLHRRSLIVVFTDFADPTSAELMLRATGRMLQTHLVLFVIMRDAELANIAQGRPEDPADVSRAVTASALLRERAIVVARLRRMGAHVLEAPHDQIGTRLVDRYVTLKRRSLL